MIMEDLPFDLDEERWGAAVLWELLAPGVGYLVTSRSEYYVALKSAAGAVLSSTAMAYGVEDRGAVLFPLERENGGDKVVCYETQRYLLRRGRPICEVTSQLGTAVYGAEQCPEYFGELVPPRVTPRGAMTRYLRLEKGIFVVETETADVLLAVSYPVWDSELQEAVLLRGEQTEYDRVRGADRTMGYLFFPRELSAVPLYELLESGIHEGLRKFVKAPEILAAAIGRYWPEYAAQAGFREGGQDTDFWNLPDSW